MPSNQSLDEFLCDWSGEDPQKASIAETTICLADASTKLAGLISQQGLVRHGDALTSRNADGDAQKPLDIAAHNLFEAALHSAPVCCFVSEEKTDPIPTNPECQLAVVMDPLDGSTNIESNLSVGSIFSIYAMTSNESFLNLSGEQQLAAGFIVYGPQTTLTLTCGEGTHNFLLETKRSEFVLIRDRISIPSESQEFAINTSNYRFWDSSIRNFIDDCVAGEDGPFGIDYNMRWNASLVAEAYRIFERGGVFLYPGDTRPGYENGRLRLLYEAFPLAFLVEQAGGNASTGEQRLLQTALISIHQRVPLIFGSSDMVDEIVDYVSGQPSEASRFPLFENRSLFRH